MRDKRDVGRGYESPEFPGCFSTTSGGNGCAFF